jgi:hypothetical protein
MVFLCLLFIAVVCLIIALPIPRVTYPKATYSGHFTLPSLLREYKASLEATSHLTGHAYAEAHAYGCDLATDMLPYRDELERMARLHLQEGAWIPHNDLTSVYGGIACKVLSLQDRIEDGIY